MALIKTCQDFLLCLSPVTKLEEHKVTGFSLPAANANSVKTTITRPHSVYGHLWRNPKTRWAGPDFYCWCKRNSSSESGEKRCEALIGCVIGCAALFWGKKYHNSRGFLKKAIFFGKEVLAHETVGASSCLWAMLLGGKGELGQERRTERGEISISHGYRVV